MHVATIPPPKGESAVVAQIAAQMARYTRSISVAESERHSFQEQWYGRERNLLRQLMMQGRTSSRKSNKDATETTSEAAATSTTPSEPTGDPPATNPEGAETKAENPKDSVVSSPRDKEPGGKRKANP
jgi:hypothetical protein